MKPKGLIFLFLFLFLTGSVAPAQSGPDAKTEGELKALLKQMLDAQLAYDAAALDEIFAPDYIEISPVGEFDPREKVLGFYTPEAKSKAGGAQVNVSADDFSIRVYDNFAIVIERLNYTVSADGKPVRPPFSLRATVVCRKDKGVWKIASVQYTGIRPPQTPPTKTE